MKDLVEQRLEDLSTKDGFRFRIRCEVCGKEYANKSRRFSKTGRVPSSKEEQILYDEIYKQERTVARQIAVREAIESINFCPICKRLVCNRCFLICDELDMCRECASKLKEPGLPVSSNQVDDTEE